MTQSIRYFVDPSLLALAARRDRIAHRLIAALPASMHGHWWVAGLHDQELRLLTDNPHFVPALRYRQSELLNLINADAESMPAGPLRRLRIAITAPSMSVTSARSGAPTRNRGVPYKAACALSAMAERTDSPQLRQALLRLAAHQK